MAAPSGGLETGVLISHNAPHCSVALWEINMAAPRLFLGAVCLLGRH